MKSSMKTVQVGNWVFETKQIKARRVDEFGKPYTAIADITIVDGAAHIEGMLCPDGFDTEDAKSFKAYLLSLGFEKVKFCRFKKGKKVNHSIVSCTVVEKPQV